MDSLDRKMTIQENTPTVLKDIDPLKFFCIFKIFFTMVSKVETLSMLPKYCQNELLYVEQFFGIYIMKRKIKENDIEITAGRYCINGHTVLMDIQKAFQQYYSSLFKGSDISLEKINEYLKAQNLLRIY